MKKQPVRRLYILMLVILSILAVILGFRYLLPLFLPIIIGYFLAWLAHPIVTVLKLRFRIPTGIGSLLVIVSFLSILIIILSLVVGSSIHQVYQMLTNLPMYQHLLTQRTQGICALVEGWIGVREGVISNEIGVRMERLLDFAQSNILPRGTRDAIGIAQTFFDFGWDLIIVFLSALLFSREFNEYKEEFQNSVFYREIHMVTGVLSDLGIAYLKAQFILMCITGAICVIGCYIIRNPYAILIGTAIALFDAFPILGCGFILIPWAVILLIQGKIWNGIILLITLTICSLLRQFLEPKLVGDRIGVRPVYTLGAMYAGLKVYGTFGFFLGPLSLIAIKAIVQAGIQYFQGINETKG